MLIRMKAEAILYISSGVAIGIVAEMIEYTEETIREWLADWRLTRVLSVLVEHAGKPNAAELTRAQKEELEAILAKPPSQTGVHAEFWDVPALRDVVRIWFDVQYQSDSSCQLLLRLCGMSFELPDPSNRRRNETAVTERMTKVKAQVKDLLEAGWEVYAIDEVRLEHEAETRRMLLPEGRRTELSVDRQKTAQSFFGALSLTTRKMKLYPIESSRNTEQTILALDRLQRETGNDKIAVILDDAGFHHAKKLTDCYEPGQLLEHITPIYLPPYAPEHNPVEDVWNAARNRVIDLQRETSEETFGAFASYITDRTFDYDFEHLPPLKPADDLVS